MVLVTKLYWLIMVHDLNMGHLPCYTVIEFKLRNKSDHMLSINRKEIAKWGGGYFQGHNNI